MMQPIIRPMKETDIHDIIEISRTTWGGHDHLPSIINSWLGNPQCHPYVLEYEEKVVGVASIRVIDQGMTGWMEGLRIHESVREKGFGHLLTDYIAKVGEELDVKRLRLVTSGDNIAPMKLASSIYMDQVHTYTVFWKGDIQNIEWRYEKIKIKKLDSSSIIDMIQAYPDIIETDIPNPVSKSVVFHWDVYEVAPQNIQEIASHAKFYFGHEKESAVLIIGGEHSTREGIEWCCTIYANSKDAFLSGLSKNIKLAKEHNIDNLFCIHHPQFISLYQTVDWLQELNHELKLVLHERPL